MNKITNFIKKHKEIISYLFFGVLTTLVNFAVYAVMVKALGVKLEGIEKTDGVLLSMLRGETGKSLVLLFIANLTAWIISVIFAFVTNKLWVFNSKSKRAKTVLRELWEFTAARLATGALEWFGIPLLVAIGMNKSLFGIEGFWAKAIVSVAVVILNYIFSKFIIFKKNGREQ